MTENETTRRIWSAVFCDLPEDDLAAAEELLCAGELSPAEDARLLREYLVRSALTQSECAARLGRSQSAVANRLRLLRLPEDILARLEEAGLSERHARALLRLGDCAAQRAALEEFIRQGMSVMRAEEYVENHITARKEQISSETAGVFDALRRELSALRRRGIHIESEFFEDDKSCTVVLRLTAVKKGKYLEKTEK